MISNSGSTISAWMATADVPQAPPLDSDHEADVCVVGAGIAGVTTAYLLAREGRQVTLLDDGLIGGGETCRTTAHLSNALDDRYHVIEWLHGKEGARLAAASHTNAIDTIEEIVAREEIFCDFTRLDGYLFLGPGGRRELLERELEAAHQAGLTGVELLEEPPVPSLGKGPVLRFPRQGQFHPLRYLAGLVRAYQRHGGRVFSGAHVTDVEPGATADDPLQVITRSGPRVTARSVVIATNSPITSRISIHTKQASYRTYAIALRIPRRAIPRALYWDTLDPYHYVRIQTLADSTYSDLLIVGGEDHKTGQADDTEERFARLEAWTREHFPQVQGVEYKWSGQVLETIDGLAFIGPSPNHVPGLYVATGDSGMGMTHGTIAGLLLTDLIAGRPNPWSNLYDPARKTFRAGIDWALENLNVARQYVDHILSPDEVVDPDAIAPGHAAILRRGIHRIAAYRDESGRLHERSAICTHLGCVVHWNPTERTWDCPCHGSRFDLEGNVINGPAAEPLRPVEE